MNAAKDAGKYPDGSCDAIYGENGFMNLKGQAAVDGRAAFDREVQQKLLEFEWGLTKGAAYAYENVYTALMQSILTQSAGHMGTTA